MRHLIRLLLLALLAGCSTSNTGGTSTAATSTPAAPAGELNAIHPLPTPRSHPWQHFPEPVPRPEGMPCRDEAQSYLYQLNLHLGTWNYTRNDIITSRSMQRGSYVRALHNSYESLQMDAPPPCAAELHAALLAFMDNDLQLIQLMLEGAPQEALDAADQRGVELRQAYIDALARMENPAYGAELQSAVEGDPAKLVISDVHVTEGHQYMFVIENTDSVAHTMSNVFIRLMQADGTQIGDSYYTIYLLFPGQRMLLTNHTDRSERGTTVSAEINVLETFAVPDLTESFALSVSDLGFHDSHYHEDSTATGTLFNPGERAITDVEISAVAYDADGRFIGEGWMVVPATIPAGGSLEVELPLNIDTERPPIDRVEMEAILGILTTLE